MELAIVNNKTEPGFKISEGISLAEVRGFFLSIYRSIYRLKLIAAFLAKKTEIITNNNTK